MVFQNIELYANTNWQEFFLPITEVSRNDRAEAPFIVSSQRMYDFDKISASILPASKLGTSADGIHFVGNHIELVEFKSGFQKKISRANFDEEQAKCDETGTICENYWGQFFKRQDAEQQIIRDSIKMKALESFITIEKEILPLCPVTTTPHRLIYTVIIDADPVENMEDTLADLTSQAGAIDNPISSLRTSLLRLMGRTGPNGDTYLYDNINVYSKTEYESSLKISAAE